MTLEHLISDQLKKMLKTYQELTGLSPVPDIDDYINLRKEALSEVRLGVANKDVQTEAPVRPANITSKKKEVSQTPKKESPVIKEDKSPPNDVKPKESARKENQELPFPESPNDFSILKSIGDPWN